MATEEEATGLADMSSGDEESGKTQGNKGRNLRRNTGVDGSRAEASRSQKNGEKEERIGMEEGFKKVKEREDTSKKELKQREVIEEEQENEMASEDGDRGVEGKEGVRGNTVIEMEEVLKINGELRHIMETIEKENNGKVAVTTDQKNVRKSLFNIQCHINTFMCKMMNMQKEVQELKWKKEMEKSKLNDWGMNEETAGVGQIRVEPRGVGKRRVEVTDSDEEEEERRMRHKCMS